MKRRPGSGSGAAVAFARAREGDRTTNATAVTLSALWSRKNNGVTLGSHQPDFSRFARSVAGPSSSSDFARSVVGPPTEAEMTAAVTDLGRTTVSSLCNKWSSQRKINCAALRR